MKNIFITLFIGLGVLSACKKDAGEGGLATVKGKLFGQNVYNKSAALTSEDGEADEDVYIVYGDNTVPGADAKTAADGSFEFKYLQKGKYKIFAYSLDTSAAHPSGKVAVYKEFEITEKKQVVDVSDFVIYKDADNDGTCSIKGRVFAKYYNSSFTVLQGSGYAPDVDVYINYGNGISYHDRVRTDANGYFQFRNLRKGSYRIFVYSEVPQNPTALVSDFSPTERKEVAASVSLVEKNKEVTIADLQINQ